MAATRRVQTLDASAKTDDGDYDLAFDSWSTPHRRGTSTFGQQSIQLWPTTASASASSPRKFDSSSPRPATSHGLVDVKLPRPAHAIFGTDSPRKHSRFASMDSAAVHAGMSGAFMATLPPPSSQFSNQKPTCDMAPYDTMSSSITTSVQFTEANYSSKGASKRALADAPSKDRSSKKQRTEKDEPFELPLPSEMPAVIDDGTKPLYSYAELIGMAILRAPARRLTLAQIYKWISDNYSFYKTSETGWQNSIRHNLSLNKNFIKQERPKDDPGKGNYWAIKPGEERPYLQGKKNMVRRITNPDGSTYMANLSSEIGHFPSSSAAPAIGQFTLAPNPIRRVESSKTLESVKVRDTTDLSSDGTIPASDPALQEDNRLDDVCMSAPINNSHFCSSPPPVDIRSSPPPATAPLQKDTPPRLPSASRHGGRSQKLGGLNDSGYWSSIESSAARGAAHQLSFDADVGRHRIKRGRAEAEIARIRSSSFDSPSKDHAQLKPPTPRFISSSPPKEEDPLTPAIVFKRPPRPPPSISPNTNLRNHRNRMRALLGSPSKPLSPLPETSLWSPAFHLGDDGNIDLTPYISPFKQGKSLWKDVDDVAGDSNSVFNNAFDVFIDVPAEDINTRRSPEKRHSRRPSLVRAATSSGILADVTGSARGRNASFPSAKEPTLGLSPFFSKSSSIFSPTKLRSPHKKSPPKLTSASSVRQVDVTWLQAVQDAENIAPRETDRKAHTAIDLFGAELLSDESEEAIDIFQDFGKIGQAGSGLPVADRGNGSPVKRTTMGPPARPIAPGLRRHESSRW